MDMFDGITKFAQDQIDCIECNKQQKLLNEDIIKLKNFVSRFKPNPHTYKRDFAGAKKYKEDFEEWDKLMRL